MKRHGLCFHLWQRLGSHLRTPESPPLFQIVPYDEATDARPFSHTWWIEEDLDLDHYARGRYHQACGNAILTVTFSLVQTRPRLLYDLAATLQAETTSLVITRRCSGWKTTYRAANALREFLQVCAHTSGFAR